MTVENVDVLGDAVDGKFGTLIDHEQPDLSRWLKLNVERLHTISSESEFRLAIRDLGKVMMFDAAFMMLGRVEGGHMKVIDIVNFEYPAVLIPEIQDSIAISDFPNAARWFAEQRPLFVPALVRDLTQSEDRKDSAEHRLGNRAIHGVLDVSETAGSYFAFGGLPEGADRWIASQLHLVVPHLHCALLRVCRLKRRRQGNLLTPRELSLLEHVRCGLTNAEIAEVWCRSAATVRNTLHRLMRKLGVRTRFGLLVEARDRQLL